MSFLQGLSKTRLFFDFNFNIGLLAFLVINLDANNRHFADNMIFADNIIFYLKLHDQ